MFRSLAARHSFESRARRDAREKMEYIEFVKLFLWLLYSVSTIKMLYTKDDLNNMHFVTCTQTLLLSRWGMKLLIRDTT